MKHSKDETVKNGFIYILMINGMTMIIYALYNKPFIGITAIKSL